MIRLISGLGGPMARTVLTLLPTTERPWAMVRPTTARFIRDSSSCSTSTAVVSRSSAAVLGEIPTTLARRSISALSRSSRLVEEMERQCSSGKLR